MTVLADISGVTVSHVSGDGGTAKKYVGVQPSGETYELYIVHDNVIYEPVTEDKIVWTTQRQGSPGSLKFTVVKDNILNFGEGDTVIFRYGGAGVFYGYVFTKTRNKKGLISVTAYDQLRYLKNKDTYVYSGKRADELFRMIAEDFKLITGEVENTGYTLGSRVEDNQELFDILQNAIDETYDNTGRLYYFYDDFGKLCLKNISSMRLDLTVNETVAEDFNYSSSIDKDVYNTVQIYDDDSEGGSRKKYVFENGENITEWGVLQLTQKLGKDENPNSLGQELLDTYNIKHRELVIKGIFGDARARAGTSLAIALNLGDIEVNTYLTVEKAVHNFSHGRYSMDLTLELKM